MSRGVQTFDRKCILKGFKIYIFKILLGVDNKKTNKQRNEAK